MANTFLGTNQPRQCHPFQRGDCKTFTNLHKKHMKAHNIASCHSITSRFVRLPLSFQACGGHLEVAAAHGVRLVLVLLVPGSQGKH
eukprot:scaffold56608_cov40-Prasinocladus_malaysianus.AAC.1